MNDNNGISQTKNDNEKMGAIIDRHVRNAKKVKCKYKYIHDSGDYFLFKCDHKKRQGILCDPRNCKLYKYGVHKKMTKKYQKGKFEEYYCA